MAMGNSTFQLLVLLFLLLVTKSPFLEAVESNSSVRIGCIEKEREALLKFKEGLKDPSGWLSSWVGVDCCNWVGVGCSNLSANVFSLDLRSPDYCSEEMFSVADLHSPIYKKKCLGGTLNPSLLNLTYLDFLDLGHNNFQGIPIPEFIGSLKNLRHLDLSFSSFAGKVPPSLGNLSNLQYLDLHSDHRILWVSDLNWITGLSSLQHLDLGDINLGKKETTSWLQIVNMLPRLRRLLLPGCELQNFPYSLPFINFTSLSYLNLGVNNFRSQIPPWLFNISSLETVRLFESELSGSIPRVVPFENLCNLQELDLSANNMSGEIKEFIEALSGCSNSSLEDLDLSRNKLSGSIPDSLGHFKYLKSLVLSVNSFTGPLPSTIANLSFLGDLSVGFNRMNGSIPESIGQLIELHELDLYGNSWEGVITENHLHNLTQLTDLYLSSSTNRSLVFKVGRDWIPSFRLQTFGIRDCQLGPAFPSWLRTQLSVTDYVILSNVGISDTIPDWFWRSLPAERESSFMVDLSDNQLRGELPKSIDVGFNTSIDLGFNSLEGSVPLWSNVTRLFLRNNSLSGPIPFNIGNEMPMLEYLDVSGNLLNGSIPLSMSKMRFLTYLDLSKNHLGGEIPSDWGDMKLLRDLDLSDNFFSGGFPGSICSLPSLVWLKLNHNNLSSELSVSLQNCSNLSLLDLGENGFFGTVSLAENLFNLSYLGLRSNLLTGKIPEQLCRFPDLHIVDLAHNNLSGSIPRCLGDMKALKNIITHNPEILFFKKSFSEHVDLTVKGREDEYTNIIPILNVIDLSGNSFAGEIPEEIANLLALGHLNLSRNQLTGRIPENIRNLQQLETLDLSSNLLSGTIPPSMSSMTFLSHLNLSYNNLSGRIPTTNQFGTFNDPAIYEGNPYLCGPPLTTDCSPGVGDTKDKNEEDENDDESGKFWLCVSMALGFVVGFWAVCGTLVIKRSWRHAYFKFVEETKDQLFVVIAVYVARLRRWVGRQLLKWPPAARD